MTFSSICTEIADRNLHLSVELSIKVKILQGYFYTLSTCQCLYFLTCTRVKKLNQSFFLSHRCLSFSWRKASVFFCRLWTYIYWITDTSRWAKQIQSPRTTFFQKSLECYPELLSDAIRLFCFFRHCFCIIKERLRSPFCFQVIN